MQAIVPGLSAAQLTEMMTTPFRTVDPAILSEPHLYRMQEVCECFCVYVPCMTCMCVTSWLDPTDVGCLLSASYMALPSTYLQAIAENGRALVALVQEKFGDGIMSAINFYFTVSEVFRAAKAQHCICNLAQNKMNMHDAIPPAGLVNRMHACGAAIMYHCICSS